MITRMLIQKNPPQMILSKDANPKESSTDNYKNANLNSKKSSTNDKEIDMSSSSDKASVGESRVRPGPAPCSPHDVSFKFIITDDVQPGALTHCFDGDTSCSFEAHLDPDASIYLFVAHFCESREDDFDLFYWLIAAFKILAEVHVKIQDTNASSKLQYVLMSSTECITAIMSS